MNNNWLITGKLTQVLSWLAIFLLPWQARWIMAQRTVNGEGYEYGVISLYATMIIVIAACVLIHWQGQKNSSPETVVDEVGAPRRQSRTSGRWRVVPGAVALVLWAIILLLRAEDHVVAVWFAVTLSIAFGYFVIARNTGRERVAQALIAAGVCQAAIAWFFFIMQHVPASTLLGVAEHSPHVLGQSVVMIFGARILRAYSTLPHPNILGGFMAVVCVLVLQRFVHKHTRRGSSQWAGGMAQLLLTFSALLISFSRSAFLAVTVALALWGIMEFKKWRREEVVRAGQAVFACLALFVVFSFMTGNAWLGRFTAVVDGGDRDALEERSVAERTLAYHEAAVVGSSGNFLFGAGLGNYVAELAQAFPSFPAYVYQPVHNAYVVVTIEIGLVGVILLMWFLKRLLLPATKAVTLGGFVRPLFFGFSADRLSRAVPFIVLLIIALFDHYLWTLYVGQSLVWLTLGMARKR